MLESLVVGGGLQKKASDGDWNASQGNPKRGLSSCGSGDPVGTVTSLGLRLWSASA